MDREQESPTASGTADPSLPPQGVEATGWVAPAPGKRSRARQLKRIGVGALISFLVVAIGYGPSNAFMLLLLAVVCTAGVGLIPLAFLSWIVGWIAIAAVEAVTRRRQGASATP
jgi:hypothetical protein